MEEIYMLCMGCKRKVEGIQLKELEKNVDEKTGYTHRKVMVKCPNCDLIDKYEQIFSPSGEEIERAE